MNKDFDDTLSQTFNLIPLEETQVPAVIPEKPADTTVSDDLNLAKDNIKDTIKVAQEAVEEMGRIAKQSQHPKSYEALARVISTAVEANKSLAEIHKSKKELEAAEDENKQNITNNNLFVGSTAELQALIQSQMKKNDKR